MSLGPKSFSRGAWWQLACESGGRTRLGAGRESGPKPGALCPVKVGSGIPMSPCGHQGGFLPKGVGMLGWRDGRGRSEASSSGGAAWTRPEACEVPTPGQGASGRSPQIQGGLACPDLSCQQGRPRTCGAVGSCLPCASTLSVSLRPAAAPVGLMHGGWVCLLRALGWEGT